MSTADDRTGQPTEIYHTGFTVSNLERSLAFYRDLLGLTQIGYQEGMPHVGEITGFPGAHVKTAFLKATPDSAHILELLEYTSHPGEPTPRETNRPGNGHICLRVDDIAALHRRLSAHGVRFISPPVTMRSGVHAGGRACYLRDPDGFTIELYQPPPAPPHTLPGEG